MKRKVLKMDEKKKFMENLEMNDKMTKRIETGTNHLEQFVVIFWVN